MNESEREREKGLTLVCMNEMRERSDVFKRMS